MVAEFGRHVEPSTRQISLGLRAGQTLSSNTCWRIEEGYLLQSNWSDAAEMVILGLWGPGECILPGSIQTLPTELTALSAAKVVEIRPTSEQQQHFIDDQLQQIATLLVLCRIRPLEQRLIQLLMWLAERFGRVNKLGVCLPIEQMALTHRHLAEMAGTTRVSVTKALGQLYQNGILIREGDQIVLRGSPSCPWSTGHQKT